MGYLVIFIVKSCESMYNHVMWHVHLNFIHLANMPLYHNTLLWSSSLFGYDTCGYFCAVHRDIWLMTGAIE
jgi:hypothetical protein